MMKKNVTIFLPDEDATKHLATRMAACLRAPVILIFRGEIGAGKTTFIRALLKTLGIQAAIKSPTFSLVETYQTPLYSIHHFDLYRIHDEVELEYIGFRDYFTNHAICCIEWPERAGHMLEQMDLAFELTTKNGGRELSIIANTTLGKETLTCLTGT